MKPHCCPVCNGSGRVSYPPGISGDLMRWSSSGTENYPCTPCGGTGVLWEPASASASGAGRTLEKLLADAEAMCRCSDDYTRLGRTAPDCQAHDFADLIRDTLAGESRETGL